MTSTMSRLLLENMLPKHVVGIILDPKRNKDVKSFLKFLKMLGLKLYFKQKRKNY